MSGVRIPMGSPNFRGIAKRPRQRTLTPSFDGSSPSTPATNDPLAQSVEHLTFNQGVPSSNLGWVTIKTFMKAVYNSFLFYNKLSNSGCIWFKIMVIISDGR